MFKTERFVSDLERAFIERFRFGIVAHVVIKQRQIVEAYCRAWVFRAERFLFDFKRALIERLRFRVVTGCGIKIPQVVEVCCGLGMFRAKCFLAELQGLNGKRNRLGILARLKKFLYPPIEFIRLGNKWRWRRCTCR